MRGGSGFLVESKKDDEERPRPQVRNIMDRLFDLPTLCDCRVSTTFGSEGAVLGWSCKKRVGKVLWDKSVVLTSFRVNGGRIVGGTKIGVPRTVDFKVHGIRVPGILWKSFYFGRFYPYKKIQIRQVRTGISVIMLY